MAKFRFDHFIDIHWNGYDIVGDGGTIFSIPDQLYEEFEADLRPVEPSLEWTVVNEFLELQNSVSVVTLEAVAPIVVTPTSTGRSISLNANYSTTSHLHDGTYQPFGTYVTSVSGTAPITTSGTTAITVGVDQTSITANSATNASVLRAYVKNSTGTTLNKGQVVYISGADGANALISLSSASSEAGSSKTLGLLSQTLTTGSHGYVIENGLLGDIDTSAATAGQAVWLGNTPGSFVFGSPPAEPSHSVYLGVVTRVQSNNGEILVKVQNGYELDELHDVSAASPSDGDIIQYKTSSALWTKASIANAGIAATVHTHGTTDVTSGNFVATATGGTGVTVTGGTGNASTPSIAIGQAVGTSSNVTFNNLTVGGDIEHASQLDFSVGGAVGVSVISSGLYLPPGKTVMFEGTTNNTAEIELTAEDATVDRTITLPNDSGTVALTYNTPPVGSVMMWMTATAPSGWLFLDGSTVSQATYPALAAVFGVGSGTFNLPDMRDRFVAGRAATADGWANNAGTFAPNTENIHTHTTNIAHGHSDTIAVSTHGDHTHSVNPAATASGGPSGTRFVASGAVTEVANSTHTHTTDIAATTSGAENTNLTHTVTGGVTSLGATSVTSSNGTISPKSTLVNFIIKT
jgi:hypothetical protein